MQDFDILIVGGGMVGASLAHALSGHGFRIGVIEAWPLDSAIQPSYDDRVIALSWGSRLILQGLGAWPGIEAEAEPIRHIHISDRGHFGFTRLNHEEEGVAALGYVVTARALGASLLNKLGSLPDVEVICPASLQSFSVNDTCIEVKLSQDDAQRKLSAKLLVAADGGDSRVRKLLSIEMKERGYGQTAIIANLTSDRAHDGIAYERFTDSGPLAMLPMTERRISMVWTAQDDQVAELMGLSNEAFLQRLQDRFGYRLGRLQRLGKRVAYPLRLRQAMDPVRSRVALVGNAAHVIHPVTGQGFNLGLRDVSVIADILIDARQRGRDPGDVELLNAYQAWRDSDQNRVASITDGLARLFANPFAPLRLVRNMGLLGLDLMPGLKHLVARQFMGIHGYQPRLERSMTE
ncbi:MAG: 2-octaprenyl-6-methoxyphenyl hydroxylase [Candidatus Thiodiazotropha sp.]